MPGMRTRLADQRVLGFGSRSLQVLLGPFTSPRVMRRDLRLKDVSLLLGSVPSPAQASGASPGPLLCPQSHSQVLQAPLEQGSPPVLPKVLWARVGGGKSRHQESWASWGRAA